MKGPQMDMCKRVCVCARLLGPCVDHVSSLTMFLSTVKVSTVLPHSSPLREAYYIHTPCCNTHRFSALLTPLICMESTADIQSYTFAGGVLLICL